LNEPTITLGIDLASQPAKTGLCAVEWRGGEAILRVLAAGSHEGTSLHDKFLVTAIRGLRLDFGGVPITKAAIDAPFGWPEPFVEAVVSHQHGDGWPSLIDEKRKRFERRATDRFVYDRTGKLPLSVSTDRIAYPAMRCAALLADIRRHDGRAAVDPAGRGMVCEAYPDRAVRIWTAGEPRSLGPRESYKGPMRANRREELLAIVVRRLRVSDPEGLLARCVPVDDCFDAFVCALVARAAALGQTQGPCDAESGLAAVEGWIHLPACNLGDLVS
jgi:hypothetical protein